MFSLSTLLSLILVTLGVVDATSVRHHNGKATLGFATRINARGMVSIADKDRARAHAMMQTGSLDKRSASSGVTNAGMIYTAQVGVGNPATNYTLLVDTGSSLTWVGSSKTYVRTKTSRDTGGKVSVTYGSGYFSGEEWLDTVTLSPALVIKQQSIGVAHTSEGFYDVDGIPGVGPVNLTFKSVNNTKTVPTVSDNLLSQGKVSKEALGVYFVPSSQSTSIGELTFGGYDNSVVTSPVNYTPLTTTSPASRYWGYNQSITYGSTTILSLTAGIVDTGTTLILLASDAFQRYQNAAGGVFDENTGLLSISPTQYANLQPLTFHVAGQTYNLSPNGQIWPRSLNIAIGGNASSIYLVVGDLRTPSGSGFDFVNGYTFLERYYSVYDTTNRRVGFANTAYTQSTSN